MLEERIVYSSIPPFRPTHSLKTLEIKEKRRIQQRRSQGCALEYAELLGDLFDPALCARGLDHLGAGPGRLGGGDWTLLYEPRLVGFVMAL